MLSCYLFVFLMLVTLPSLAVAQAEEKVLGYTSVTYELATGVTGYSSFLTRSRNAVEAPIRACGVQSTRSTPLRGAEYIYINLKISNNQWVTLGVDVKSFYVWGYQDNYNTLEPAAGVNRLNLVLGIQNLDGAIRSVYGRQEAELNQGNAEARFFLTAMQMVAEAARFKVMEAAIVWNDGTPDIKKKLVAFQNDWSTISNAIHKAEAEKLKCNRISPTLVISRIWYRQEVNTMDEIQNDLGLIKYYKKSSASTKFGTQKFNKIMWHMCCYILIALLV